MVTKQGTETQKCKVEMNNWLQTIQARQSELVTHLTIE